MKEDFERILKQQLENYEMPYDNGAWEQFSMRLDGTPSTPFYRKWWFAASVGTVLVGSAAYFTLSSREQNVHERVVTEQTTAEHAAPLQTTPAQPESADVRTPAKQVPSAGKQQHVHERETYTWTNVQSTPENPLQEQQPADRGTTTEHRAQMTPAGQTFAVQNAPRLVKFEAPATICMNESFTVKNPNDVPISVTLPNGRTKTIAGKQSAEIAASEAGRITLRTNGQTEVVLVNEPVSHLIIDIDASLLYENGIPTLKFNVLNADHAVTWKSNVNPQAQSVSKNGIVVHPYQQRDVTVTAYSTDQNGCPVSESKTITLEKVYNLLAPTGFNPTSSDERTNRFIPYALTERDTPFEMIIMDAKTMTVVYRTTDASQGWDGIDSRNGQMAAPGSTWLWKVMLKNPQPGEQSEYSGIVTTKRVY